MPLLPHTTHSRRISGEQHAALIQLGGDGVVKVDDGAGLATLSIAYARTKLTNAFRSSAIWTA